MGVGTYILMTVQETVGFSIPAGASIYVGVIVHRLPMPNQLELGPGRPNGNKRCLAGRPS